jgi:3-oxoacyl-[acyl-carrier protein] reductase
MQLDGQVALITGGTRGIGRATALLFAQHGADIAFCHMDEVPVAEATAQELAMLGRRVVHARVDVSDVAAARDFAADAAARLGAVDILFNNAGINVRKPFTDVTEADWDRVMDVHAKGMFFLAQAVFPAMAKRGRGCIINVASQLAFKGAPEIIPYCAAKAAIVGFTRALAHAAAPLGVRVNAIAPGPVDTDLLRQRGDAFLAQFAAVLPARRIGTPEEIAATALLLAGPHGGFYVGACLSPNGGDVMH